MIKLPVITPLPYISPSTYNVLRSCEMATYYIKMSGKQIEKEPQTEQMALGSAFDSHIKAEIAQRLGLKNNLKDLLKSVDPHMTHMIKFAKAIADTYIYYGALDKLLEVGIKTVESKSYKVMKNSKGEVDFVLFGYPDAELSNLRPHDWKVGGWGSKTNRSPKPGYIDYIVPDAKDFMKFTSKGKHKSYGIPFEAINEDWAVQLLMYGWFCHGYTEGATYHGSLHQVILQPDNRVCIAFYDTYISKEFAKQVYDNCVGIWDRFSRGEVKEPVPDSWTCEPYRKPRICTLVCDAYKRSLGDPVHRQIMESQFKK